MSWMVPEVEQAAKASWLAAGNIPITGCKGQFAHMEMLPNLDLGVDAR
jgi:hypothetical protein